VTAPRATRLAAAATVLALAVALSLGVLLGLRAAPYVCLMAIVVLAVDVPDLDGEVRRPADAGIALAAGLLVLSVWRALARRRLASPA
jgi:hypothetical protein